MTEHRGIAAALSAFQGAVTAVAKGNTADTGTYKYRYADLAAITQVAYPLLAAHGLSFTCLPRSAERGYEMVGKLLHSSGEELEACLPLFGTNAQQLGSSITYARRYLLGAMTGIVTDEDDDGQQAQQAPRARRDERREEKREPSPLFAIKKRAVAAASRANPDLPEDQVGAWVKAAMEARGLNPESVSDVMKLAEELETAS